MYDYSLKFNLKPNDLYDKIKINLKPNDYLYDKIKINYSYTKITTITKTKPLLKIINCVKVGDSKNYECDVTEYRLRLCISESESDSFFNK